MGAALWSAMPTLWGRCMTKFPLSFDIDIGELRGNDFHEMQQDLLRRVHAVQRELTAGFVAENPGIPCEVSTHQDGMLMVVTVSPATIPEQDTTP